MLGAGALGRPRGMVPGGRREEDSGWGTRVYLWRVHVDIWQNQYNIAKLKNKKKETNKQKRCACDIFVDLKGKCDRGPAHRHLKLLEGDCQVWRSLA